MAQNDIYLVRQKADATFEEIAHSPFQYDAANITDLPDKTKNTFHINTKLRVDELEVNGKTTVIHTDTNTSEQLLVTNDGTGPAAVINQLGQFPLIDIQDDGTSALFIRGDSPYGGFVGLGTTTPDEQLHLTGSILLENEQLLMAKNISDTKVNILGMSNADITNLNNVGNGITMSVGAATADPKLFMHPSGRVGLGIETNDPGAVLEVKRDGDSNVLFSHRTASILAEINVDKPEDKVVFKTLTDHALSIGTNALDFLTLTKEGNLTLEKKLSGSTLTGGDLTIDGNFTSRGDMVSFGTEELLFSKSLTSSGANVSKSYRVLEVGYNTHHWDHGTSFIIEVYSNHYSSQGYQKYILNHTQLDTSVIGSQDGLVDKTGSRDYVLKILEHEGNTGSYEFRARLGAPEDTGVNVSNYDVALVPLYIDVTNYANVRVKVTSFNSDSCKRISIDENWGASSADDEYKFNPLPTAEDINWTDHADLPGSLDYTFAGRQALYADVLFGDGRINRIGERTTHQNNIQWALKLADIDTSLTVAGKAGIGTSSPDHRLDVVGSDDSTHDRALARFKNAGTRNNDYSEIHVESNAGTTILGTVSEQYTNANWADSHYLYGTGTVARNFYIKSKKDLIFFTGGTDLSNRRMTITAGGDIGIGTTTPNDTRLEITTTQSHTVKNIAKFVGPDPTISFVDNTNNNTITNTNYMKIGWQAAAGVSGGMRFFRTTADNPDLIIDLNGAVGIGTTSPDGKFDVQGDFVISRDSLYTSQWKVGVTHTAVDNYGSLYFTPEGNNSSTADWGIRNSGGLHRFTVKSSGYVGIGTPAPSEKLHVSSGKLLVAAYDIPVANANDPVAGATFFSRREPLTGNRFGSGIDIVPIAEGGHCSPFIRFYDTGANGDYDDATTGDNNWAIGADDTAVSTFKFNWGGGSGSNKPTGLHDTSTHPGINRLAIDGPTGDITIQGGLFIPSNIYHNGDHNTWMGFHSDDHWRVVTQGTERLEVNSDATTVNNVLQAHGGMTIATNATGTPELTLKRSSSTSASGNDDIVDIRVGDSVLTFVINNDDDGDGGTYNFRRMAAGLEIPAAINCDTITTNGIIRKNGDTNTYLEFHSADRLRLVTGGVQQLEVTNSGLFIQDFIKHTGDDNTYFGFHNPDQWRVVTGGGERFVVTNTEIALKKDTSVTGDLTVSGDFTVTGKTITNNVEVVSTSNGVVFEGSVADDHEGTLKASTLTADRTYTLPNKSGTVAMTSDNYTHPLFSSGALDIDTGPMTGATVISDLDFKVQVNGEGHVSNASAGMGTVSTRELTVVDLVGQNGSNGQVLTSNGSGGVSWTNKTTDTNTQLTETQISNMGFTKNTQLTETQISAMGFIKTDTNTQLTDSQISAMGFTKNALTALPTNTVTNASVSGNTLTLTRQGGTNITFTATNSPGGGGSTNAVEKSGAQTMAGPLTITGTNASNQSLLAAGDVVAMTSSSDERLKKNILKVDSALDKICSLEGFTFDWNDKAKSFGIKSDTRELGLSAQETEKVIPEAVKTFDESDYKYINYEKLVPVLVEAIKELKSEIQELKKNQCDC